MRRICCRCCGERFNSWKILLFHQGLETGPSCEEAETTAARQNAKIQTNLRVILAKLLAPKPLPERPVAESGYPQSDLHQQKVVHRKSYFAQTDYASLDSGSASPDRLLLHRK